MGCMSRLLVDILCLQPDKAATVDVGCVQGEIESSGGGVKRSEHLRGKIVRDQQP